LESGGGADSSQWSALQPELNRRTGWAVISYDRAGFGESDLPSTPYNAIEEVAGLRVGLERLGPAKKVVLVGHSYGGLLNQLYAHQYSKSVKGIGLIDSNTVAFVDAIGGPKQLMEIPFPTTPPRPLGSGLRICDSRGIAIIRGLSSSRENRKFASLTPILTGRDPGVTLPGLAHPGATFCHRSAAG